MRGLSGAQLPAARDGSWAVELGWLLLVVNRSVLVRHQVLVFGLGLPVTEVVFGIVQDLAGLGAVGVRLSLVAWHDGTAVQEL